MFLLTLTVAKNTVEFPPSPGVSFFGIFQVVCVIGNLFRGSRVLFLSPILLFFDFVDSNVFDHLLCFFHALFVFQCFQFLQLTFFAFLLLRSFDSLPIRLFVKKRLQAHLWNEGGTMAKSEQGSFILRIIIVLVVFIFLIALQILLRCYDLFFLLLHLHLLLFLIESARQQQASSFDTIFFRLLLTWNLDVQRLFLRFLFFLIDDQLCFRVDASTWSPSRCLCRFQAFQTRILFISPPSFVHFLLFKPNRFRLRSACVLSLLLLLFLLFCEIRNLTLIKTPKDYHTGTISLHLADHLPIAFLLLVQELVSEVLAIP